MFVAFKCILGKSFGVISQSLLIVSKLVTSGKIRGKLFDIRINPNNKADDHERIFGVELIDSSSGFKAYITKQLDQYSFFNFQPLQKFSQIFAFCLSTKLCVFTIPSTLKTK
jgi:hypothetical protein